MNKYHNAYWNSDRTNIEADIIEIDVIYRFGKLKLSHGIITYGNAEEYFRLLDKTDKYLCIEIKSSSIKIIKYLEKLIDKYKVKLIIDVTERWYTFRRQKLAESITVKFQLPYWKHFKIGRQIETVQLHNTKPLYRRLLHF